MSNSWFFEANFNGVPDDFFDDAVKFFDFPLEDVEPADAYENWDDKFLHLEPQPFKENSCFPPGPHAENGSSSASIATISSSASCDNAYASQLKQWPKTNETLSSGIINPTHYEFSELKYSIQSRTCSPVSVLESSSGSCCAENPILHPTTFAVRRPRSDCPRRRRQELPVISFTLQKKTVSSAKKNQMKTKNFPVVSNDMDMEKSSMQQGAIRRCVHCLVTKTPQWREGPMGPKTLCNACGVRFRSGRLYPEYRPAASPTFVPTLHSNSHRKVLEMRQKATSNSKA